MRRVDDKMIVHKLVVVFLFISSKACAGSSKGTASGKGIVYLYNRYRM